MEAGARGGVARVVICSLGFGDLGLGGGLSVGLEKRRGVGDVM